MRLGAVPYLNALPLCRYLPGPVRFETPAVLERLMGEGELDAALLPSLAFLKNPSYHPHFEGGIIGSNGPVESVTLFLRQGVRDPSAVRSLSLTSDSVTSVALLKILFALKWKRPFPSTQTEATSANALLKIGDAALFFDDPAYRAIDLGKEWTDWTGLPFIYALWVSAKPLLVTPILAKAKKEGLERMEEIIASCRDLPEARLRTYLTKSIQYEITPAMQKGLRLFCEYALKTGLLRHAG
ncbi:MAG: menaquinone biosynthesis protein [Deltaproteobacteria bacterium]|nr:menaquinone biosynthesis protein [Deltaproteobacteria bacterium]